MVLRLSAGFSIALDILLDKEYYYIVHKMNDCIYYFTFKVPFMKEELDILRIVSDYPNISQRRIAQQTGVSLGQVNFLIKKCVKKGLIKIEGQTSKSLRYNLTPKGLTEKAALTLKYIKISYTAVVALTDKIRELADKYQVQGKKIYVYGDQDEMMEICKLALEQYSVKYVSTQGDHFLFDNCCLVFYWDERNKSILESSGIKAVNLLI